MPKNRTTKPRKKHAIYTPSGEFVRKIKPMKRIRGGQVKKGKGGHKFHRMKSIM